jgi:hypothetical protein
VHTAAIRGWCSRVFAEDFAAQILQPPLMYKRQRHIPDFNGS